MLVIDIGNTRINFALFNQAKLIKRFFLATKEINLKNIKDKVQAYSKEEIIVCSVVPKVTSLFKQLPYQKVLIVGQDIKVPMKCYYNLKSIGMDRLVGAFAARRLYPKTRIIIDFGTAITFDVLSKQGDYLGGFILPGMGSTLRVLSNCAMLPKRIKLSRIKKIIPQETKDSISKGIEEGFSLMLSSLVAKYKRVLSLDKADTIVITGGEASFIIPKLDFIYKYEELLVEKGLLFLAEGSDLHFGK